MIRFIKDDPSERYGGRYARFFEQEEEFDDLGGSKDQISLLTPSAGESASGGEDGEDGGFVWPWQLADGDWERRNDIPVDATIIVRPPRNASHTPQNPIRCIYYTDTKYALCGHNDHDLRVEPFGPQLRYSTQQEAEDALFNKYGYGNVPGYVRRHNPLVGEYSKAFEGDFRYRWQAFINGTDQRGWLIRTQGPEPDPAFFYLFPDGFDAVADWHEAW